MKVFVKTTQFGIPESESEYAAWEGFRLLGCDTVFYNSVADLKNCRPDDLIVGGVSVILRELEEYGIKVKNYDYPEELQKYLGRKIWEDTLGSVLLHPEKWPLFIKPVRNKAFIGFVLRSEKNLPRFRNSQVDEPVYCSEIINIAAEWRAFVKYGNIFDVRPYSGDWHLHFDADILENAVKDFSNAPAGYAMDIGVTDKGQTILIEINDGFALGSYGTDPIQYARLLSARWCEMIGIRDECDTYLEAVDWKKRKYGV